MVLATVPGAVGKCCPDPEPPSLLREKPTSPRHREVAHHVSVLRGLLFSSQTPLQKGTFGGQRICSSLAPRGYWAPGLFLRWGGGRHQAFLELCIRKLKAPRRNLQRCSESITWGQYCLANFSTVFIQVFL